MNEHLDAEVGAEKLAELASLLRDAELWSAPDQTTEDAVVLAIAHEAARPAPIGVPSPVEAASGRRWRTPQWLAGAAAVIAIVVAGVMFTRGSGSNGTVFALAGTDAAPSASGEARVSATPAGLKIILVARGLPGAPDGYMYEAWVSDGTIGVSAGTFHLRGGDGPIELWAGVTDGRFQRLTITLEPVDGDTSSTRDAWLVGTIDIADR